MRNKIDRFPSLDGLRAISIIIVILSHLILNKHIPFHFLTDIKLLMPLTLLFTDGGFGVNVFFIISGFLITSLLLKEEFKGEISLKKFYLRRTIRIFPAYYFLLFIYFILYLFNYIEIGKTSWLSSLTYTKYFFPNYDFITDHFWSLSVEEHFYLLWPLLFMGGSKVRKWSLLVLIFAVPLVKIYSHFYETNFYGHELFNNNSIFFRVDSIAIGCLVAIYLEKILEIIKPKFSLIFRFSIIALILIRFIPKVPAKIGFEDYFVLDIFFNSIGPVSNILIVIIMLYSIFGPNKIWFNFLNSPIIKYIGVLSYSLYLYQQFFTAKNNYWICQFPQNLLFIFFTAIFSYHIIEKPFLKLKDKFSN
jgi:peptidoglycan/LPS O-acetylase OafA/YrhL